MKTVFSQPIDIVPNQVIRRGPSFYHNVVHGQLLSRKDDNPASGCRAKSLMGECNKFK